MPKRIRDLIMTGSQVLAACLALVALAVTGAFPVQAQDPVHIRVSWVAVPNNLPPLLFQKEGVAKHLGKSYTFEAVQYRGTPQSITAMATGDLEIALLSYSSFPRAILNADMEDLRVIADEFQDGQEGYYSGEFMVLKDGPVKEVSDLEGKIVAVNVKGGATHGAVNAVLQAAGLEEEEDYTVLEVKFPNMQAVLEDGKVDLISLGTPLFSWDAGMQKIARPLFTQADAFGKTDVVFYVARAGFLEENHDAVVDFLEDMLRDRQRLLDPANHGEAVTMVSGITKIPAEKLDSWLFTERDYYRPLDAMPDLDALQANIDKLHKDGRIDREIDLSKYVDLSLLKEALARLDN